MDSKLTMDRRGFLAGGATAIAAAGLMGLAGCSGAPSGGSAGSSSTGGSSGAASGAVVNSWQNPPAPIPADQIVETVDCDVLVIGAGTAGVCAAQSAAEAGANTVLIEKCAEFSARGHDVGVVDCKVQRENGVEIDRALMREYYCQITCNKTDMGLFNIWMNNSGAVMDYYIDRPHRNRRRSPDQLLPHRLYSERNGQQGHRVQELTALGDHRPRLRPGRRLRGTGSQRHHRGMFADRTRCRYRRHEGPARSRRADSRTPWLR